MSTAETVDVSTARPIPGHPGYFATEQGQIISRKYRIPHVVRPEVSSHGYERVEFWNDNKRRRQMVHRLVLFAFHGPPPPGYICRHLDGDRRNNAISNLRWGTHSENNQDAVRHGTAVGLREGEIHPAAKLTNVQVLQIADRLRRGEMPSRIAVDFGVTPQGIRSIRAGRSWGYLTGFGTRREAA
jgi:hypothetical protein